MSNLMNNTVKRFLKYTKIDTQSDPNSQNYPSTAGQIKLAKIIKTELKKIGVKNVTIDKYKYVTGEIPSNIDKKTPIIGFLSHLDTSPDFRGKNVEPQITENYNGKEIILNREKNIILSPQEFPSLKNYKGQSLITTDGTTLLGADNKAGIAEIISALEIIIKNNLKHGTIKVAFTPDEEIGKGTEHFDIKKFGADFAYTIDGGEIGQIEYENFNAAKVIVIINGKNIHPGYAKDKMKNSILIALELQSMLPEKEKPETTENYQGFYHLNNICGTVSKTEIMYIIRDHDINKFKSKKEYFKDCIKKINKKYGKDTVVLKAFEDQYYNMKEKIIPKYKYIIDTAKKAIELNGITPVTNPIRGGTDGAVLSYKGLPCPNIFTGGENFHGKFEFIPIESMNKAVDVIVKIVELFAGE